MLEIFVMYFLFLKQNLIEARQNTQNEQRTRDFNYDKMLAECIQKDLAAAEARKISETVILAQFVDYYFLCNTILIVSMFCHSNEKELKSITF